MSDVHGGSGNDGQSWIPPQHPPAGPPPSGPTPGAQPPAGQPPHAQPGSGTPAGQPPGAWPPPNPGPQPWQDPTPPGGSYAGTPPPDFDQLTRKVGGLKSRRSILGLGLAAAVAAVAAWFVWGRNGGSGCGTGSRCDDKRYCDAEETCLCTETTEGDTRCGQVPTFCELPLCTSSADCAHLGDGWFCDVPDSGCCTDPPASLSRCIAPCGTTYPSEVRTTTTTTAPAAEPEEPEEPEPVEDDEPSHLRLTETQPEGLLFFSLLEDGSGTYFYGEDGRRGLQPTHVVYEDADGATSTIIVNEQLIPVSWTSGDLSIAARPEERNAELDPNDALHSVIVGAEEHVLRVDLVPTAPLDALGAAEDLTGERYPDARRAFRALPSDWNDVVRAAGEADDAQPQRLANTMAASIAHAAVAILEQAEDVELEEGEEDGSPGDSEADDDADASTTTTDDGPANLRSPMAAPPGASQFTQIYKLLSELLGPLLESMLKNALISAGAEELVGAPQAPTDPTVPTFDLLLCQGATKWGNVCHYTYFDRRNISGCLDFCKTDLSCFTNICMPITLSVEDAIQTYGS